MKFDNNFIKTNETFEFWGKKYYVDDVSIDSIGCVQISGHEAWTMPTVCTSSTFTYTSNKSTSNTCFDWSYEKKKSKFKIKKVQVNPKKNATTVIFEDGSVEVVKKAQEDPETDLFSAVAYAVAKHIYGSNSAFKREVAKNIQFVPDDKVEYVNPLEELNKKLKFVFGKTEE
jgi:hypothetical protein